MGTGPSKDKYFSKKYTPMHCTLTAMAAGAQHFLLV